MINIRSPREIELLRNSSKILIETFRLVDDLIEPGIDTKTINKEIDRYIRSKGAKPAFKGYRGFPASACISIDDEVVHGVPSKRKLIPGQIVGIDIGVEYNDYFSDAAKTYVIGEIPLITKKLIDITKESLNIGIQQAVAGNRLSDISHAIQKYVESAGFSVVMDLVGHGIGRELHEEPQLPNYGKANRGPRLKEGMVLAIEPMVNMGGYKVIFEKDKWTVRTADGSPSAHFEHTVVVKNGSAEILTMGR
ncbi:type I methionyl aminopeptidase [candidate division KSB1 bacterium]|nr:type I methionyl aminopeptidase [candidate division KSB1 bacterium]MBL7095002.1 type I methionyl aminopeptidase [candidate division KSB1 bacterium]